MVSFYAIAHGRVQGVSFRAFVYEKANQLGLKGFVRNLPSLKDVEIKAEGNKEDLEKLLVYLKLGPPLSEVENLVVTWAKSENNFKNFVIED
jgi:acylphosphatase